MMYVWLVVGFVLLIKGADYFVEASSSIARALRVPSIIIGLTIVAFGTSAPELAVSTTAALTGNNEIAVGNVIGSFFGVLINGTISTLVKTNGKLLSSWSNIAVAALLCFFIVLQSIFAKIKEKSK